MEIETKSGDYEKMYYAVQAPADNSDPHISMKGGRVWDCNSFEEAERLAFLLNIALNLGKCRALIQQYQEDHVLKSDQHNLTVFGVDGASS